MFDVINNIKDIHKLKIKNLSVNINESGQCALLSLYFHYIRFHNINMSSNNFKNSVLSPWEELNNSLKVSKELNIAKQFKNKSVYKRTPSYVSKVKTATRKTIRPLKTIRKRTIIPLKTIRKRTIRPLKTIRKII